MGDEALGVVTALHDSAAIATPPGQKFARAFEAKAGMSAAISQFWKHNPEEYLKTPLDTREYPPGKAC